MASSEGFLTEEQRERLTIATQNSEVLSSSPKSPSSLLSEHHIKAPAGGKGAVGVAGRHVRRTHSGKLARVKKGECVGYVIGGRMRFISLSRFVCLRRKKIIIRVCL